MTAAAPSLAEATFRSDHMPAEGRMVHVTATAGERAGIGAFLEVSAVPHLAADLVALKFRDGVRVTGRLRAEVVQPCVVTFVPVHQQIDEPVDRVFVPGRDKPPAGSGHAEVLVDPDDDAPDYFEGPEIDLSDLVLEILALAIDPYPRAPGARLDDVLPPGDGGSLSPFAALQSLKNRNRT